MFIYYKYKYNNYQYIATYYEDEIRLNNNCNYLLKYDNFIIHSVLFLVNLHYFSNIYSIIIYKGSFKKYLNLHTLYIDCIDYDIINKFYSL